MVINLNRTHYRPIRIMFESDIELAHVPVYSLIVIDA